MELLTDSDESLSLPRRSLLPRLLRPLAALLLLGLVFALVPFSEVASVVGRASVGIVLAAWALALAGAWVGAWQVKPLADRRELGLTTRQIFEINLTTGFYGLFLPGYLATGALRWHRMAQGAGKPAGALACVAFNRLIETAVMAGYGVAFLALDRSAASTPAGLALIGVAALGACLSWVVFLGRSVSRAELGAVVSRCVLRHALGLAGVFLLAVSIKVEVSLITLGWVRSAVEVLALLPLSISGLGVREGALAFLLTPYGVLPQAAVALALLMFSRAVFVGAIGGLIEARNLLGLQKATRLP